MTRKGKIARLPNSVREHLNERIQDGKEGKEILDWLNGIDEVKAILASKFDGQPISDGNLSLWKEGGYRDWQDRQFALAAITRINDDVGELRKEAKTDLAEQLALCLTAKFAVAIKALPTLDGDLEEYLKSLNTLAAQLIAIRRGNHSAERVRIEAEHLAISAARLEHDKNAWSDKNGELRSGKREGGITEATLREIEEGAHLL